jgi:MFS family permease
MFCGLYSIALYLQACLGLSPTITGVGILGLNFGLLTVSVVSGRLITNSGRYRWAIWSGWGTIISSTAIMIALDASTPTYGWVLLFVPLGVGHGLLLISLNFSIQALAKERDGAYAAGMYTFARTFGMCLGVSIGGTVLHNTLLRHLREAQLDENIAHNAEGYIFNLNDPRQGILRESDIRVAYAAAFRNVFEVLTAIAVLGGLFSLLIKHASLDRALESEHVFEKKADESSAA